MFLSSPYSNVFVRYMRLFAHGWRSQIFGVSRKENSILQYAAMFNKETIYSWNRHFILKFGASFSRVC